jgi:asparagine synthase (glutamine-hydrolysing)
MRLTTFGVSHLSWSSEMATRYLAFISEHREQIEHLERRLTRSSGWVRAHTSRRSVVYVDQYADRLILPDATGLIVGHIFPRHGDQRPVTAFDGRENAFIRQSRGQRLVAEYWGGYVAILEDDDGTHINVLRDPSGAMPCYTAIIGDVICVASDIDTLFDCGSLPTEIDWEFILRHLLAYDVRDERTGFAGLTELLAGFRLEIVTGACQILQIWSPWSYVTAQPETHYANTAADLRATILNVTAAWSCAFPSLMLGLSGGLDSSILAAALIGRGKSRLALTMATDEAEGDERDYARLVAQATGLPLVEHFYRLEDINIERSASAHLPRPIQCAFGESEHKVRRELARAYGANAYITGIGGDNVFCHMRSAAPIVDRLLQHGLGAGTWTTVQDVCALNGCSVWEAISRAAERLAAPRNYRVSEDRSFLAPGVTADAQAAKHPWLKAPAEAVPGKAAHVAALARIQGTIDGYSRKHEPPLVLPLLSQPVVEACLAIPTWQWIKGGVNRSVARAAFAADLPPEIVSRRTKGGPSSFAYEVIHAYRKIVRDLLVDGMLASRGIVDREALDKALRGAAPIPASAYMRLTFLTEVETWLRHWADRTPPAKAI